MRDRYGLTLEKKKLLVEGRLTSVLQDKRFPTISAYINHVVQDKTNAEAGTLLTRLTTNFTYFMREKVHYDYLLEHALPELTPSIGDRDLRTWSAGCSSGEEPYTLVMTYDDYFGARKAEWDATVLATDISPTVLRQAADAVYSPKSMEHLPRAYAEQYFVKLSPSEYRVTDALRREVVFRPFNLMDSPVPFRKKFHIIFCRNVMIYFSAPTRAALVQRFYDALVPGGYFFISLAENLARGDTGFEMLRPSIYRKPGGR